MEAPPAATYWTLPSDLLLEIVARSDISTVVAFALACKLLRRDILSSSFIRRLTQRGGIVPPCILAYLHTHNNMDDPPAPFSLVHPATPAASACLNDYISPSVSRFAHELLAEHKPLTSRGGLILFRRRRDISNKLCNLCVYDVFRGRCTVFSDPIDPNNSDSFKYKYVLLTAADGIDCPFLICVLNRVTLPDNIYASAIEVHTATSMSNTWAHTITSNINSTFFWKLFQENIVVLQGGVIHWLARESGEIASYNVCTREHGTIKLPGPVINCNGEVHLGSYYPHDENKLLRLVTLNKTFNISVWHQLPNGNWESEALMVDLEEKLRSLDPYSGMIVQFGQSSSEKTNIALLHISIYVSRWPPTSRTIILDLETKEMRELHCPTSSLVMEIDLSSRLRDTKVFH